MEKPQENFKMKYRGCMLLVGDKIVVDEAKKGLGKKLGG